MARTQTDLRGRYRLGSIGVGKPVEVWFDGVGLARDRRAEVLVFEGRDNDIGAFVMVDGTRIVGRVVDQKGQPIAACQVEVEIFRRILAHTVESNQTRWELVSDADGRFQSVSLPAGEGQLNFNSTGKVRTRVDRRTLPGVLEMDLGDLTLNDEAPVRGVVVDQSGKPAPRVEVIADYDYKNLSTTDDQGKFSIGGLNPEAKEIILRSNAYFSPKAFPIGPDRTNLRLEVLKAFEIFGTAVDAETGARVNVDTVRLCMVVHEPDGTTSLRG